MYILLLLASRTYQIESWGSHGGSLFPIYPAIYYTIQLTATISYLCLWWGSEKCFIFLVWFLSAGGSKSSDTLTVQQQIQSHKKMISMDGIYVCPASQKQGSISVYKTSHTTIRSTNSLALAWLEATEGALLPFFHRRSVVHVVHIQVL